MICSRIRPWVANLIATYGTLTSTGVMVDIVATHHPTAVDSTLLAMPQAATTAHKRPWPTSTPPALLIAVVDLHPLAWSLLSNLQPTPGSPGHEKEKAPIAPLTLGEFATNLMVFLNAHLASRWGNDVVVYGATAGTAVLLYPQPGESSQPQPNFYRPFQLLDTRFEEQLKAVVAAEEERLSETEGKGLNGSLAFWVLS